MTPMPPEWECLRAALPRLVLLYDLSLLLLSAAALPVLRQCGLITVYRCTHQCGERSNAASVRSLPPSKRHSRLTVVRRGCELSRNVGVHGEAMYTAPDCAARAVIQE